MTRSTAGSRPRLAPLPALLALALAAAWPAMAAALDLEGAFRSLTGKRVGEVKPAVAGGLRVMTYNLHGAYQLVPFGVADVVRKAAPDVALLTECVEGVALYGDQPAYVGRIARMPHRAFQPNNTAWTRVDRFGNAILSKTPLADVRRVKLPLLAKANEPRGLLAARTKIGGREVVVACTHLSRATESKERAEQIAFVADYLAKHYAGLPVILGGDFNTGAGDERFAPLAAGFEECHAAACAAGLAKPADGFTIDAKKPTARFDHLFVSRDRFRVTRAWTVASEASDHRPALAEVEFR